jgi:hypothetical protein
MNATTDWYVVWELRIVLGLWIAIHLPAALSSLAAIVRR